MKILRILRVSTKYGLGGGTVYYSYELGLWKNSDESIKNYANFKKDVNGFLDSSPALVGYVRAAGDSVQNSIKPVTEPVSNFRNNWLNFDLCEKTRDGIVKTTWNSGVGLTVDLIAATPRTLGNWTVSGWNKVADTFSDSSTS